MGAGFCSLYRKIHYIKVHYIEVWVYVCSENWTKDHIQVVCKEVVVSSSRQFYGITLSSTEVRWVTKMGREGRFSKNFKVSGNMDGMAAAVDQQQMIFRRRHHSRNNSNFIFETQKLNFWPAYFDKNIYLVPRYF